MTRYSAFALVRTAISGHRHWGPAWRSPDPKPAYDVVIVGGCGHGRATAFYLAENYSIRKVAVLERGYIGGGNVGRNTTIERSNYLLDGNTQVYEFSLKLWEGLSFALNFNVMFSQRGQLTVAHSVDQLDQFAHRANIMRLNGIDAEILDRAGPQDDAIPRFFCWYKNLYRIWNRMSSGSYFPPPVRRVDIPKGDIRWPPTLGQETG